MDYQTAKRGDVEVRVDFSRPATSIDYRIIGPAAVPGESWEPSVYQSADLNHLTVEQVFTEVIEWLDGN